MCIIITKDAGVATPNTKVLKRCFHGNPDGAGLAWRDAYTGQIHISKGYMRIAGFLKAHRKLAKLYDLQACDVIYHFRIATAGDVSPGLCHPFPVSDKIAELIAPRLTPRIAVAHNGHITGTSAGDSYYSYTAGKYSYSPDVSDTSAFIQDELTPLASDFPRFYESPALMSFIQARINSKMAFLTPTGIYRTGHFIHDKPTGLYYSNGGYKPTPATAYPYTTSYGRRGGTGWLQPDDDGNGLYTSPYDYTTSGQAWRDTWRQDGGRVHVDHDTVSDDVALVATYLITEGGDN